MDKLLNKQEATMKCVVNFVLNSKKSVSDADRTVGYIKDYSKVIGTPLCKDTMTY